VHNVGPVRLNGPDGDLQHRSDLLIRLPLAKQSEDFNFTRPEWNTFAARLLMPVLCIEKRIENDFGYFRRQETLTFRDRCHGRRKTVREIGLQNVSSGASLQRAAHHLVRFVHREHKNLDVRIGALTPNALENRFKERALDEELVLQFSGSGGFKRHFLCHERSPDAGRGRLCIG